MKGHAKHTDQRAISAAAREGGEWAFRELLEPYRRSLEVHVYTMLGLAQRNPISAPARRPRPDASLVR
jgi:hypothetical protein